MYKGMKVCAIIVAAGKGRRMGNNINKLFLTLRDKPILTYTLQLFESIEMVDNIVVVAAEDEIDYCKENIIDKYKVKNISYIVKGGKERQDSIMSGLEVLKGKCDIVVTHDGARPFVTCQIIEESIIKAYLYSAAACAVNVKDTIKIADFDDYIIDSPDRSKLYAVQTPQTFRFDVLYKAHLSAIKDGFIATDDTLLVERIGIRVKLFKGSYENIKITTPEDIFMAEGIMRYKDRKQD